jgi:hypothetical protein
MGLLDEAIREHLELKRRQGADPGEIARKEKEALAPVLPDEPSSWGADASTLSSEHDLDAVPEERDPIPPAPVGETTHQPDFSTVGQETAELDMQAVLDADATGTVPSSAPSAGSPGAGHTPDAYVGRASQDEALDWEIPREDDEDEHVIHEIPGQERLSFE